MNRKISRNGKHKYSNEENLTLGEDENTIANIALEDDRNIFEMLHNLCKKNNLKYTIFDLSS